MKAGNTNAEWSMRIILMLLGAVICIGATAIWIYLNGMAGAWTTSASPSYLSIDWFTGEALWWFWLPVAVGAAIAFCGWKRR